MGLKNLSDFFWKSFGYFTKTNKINEPDTDLSAVVMPVWQISLDGITFSQIIFQLPSVLPKIKSNEKFKFNYCIVLRTFCPRELRLCSEKFWRRNWFWDNSRYYPKRRRYVFKHLLIFLQFSNSNLHLHLF